MDKEQLIHVMRMLATDMTHVSAFMADFAEDNKMDMIGKHADQLSKARDCMNSWIKGIEKAVPDEL